MMSNSVGYEKKDVNLPKVIGLGVFIMFAIVFILIFLNEYFLAEKEKMVEEFVLKPESAMLRDIRAAEDEIINSYKLLDSAKGIYRIPIERAMELIADEAYQDKLKK